MSPPKGIRSPVQPAREVVLYHANAYMGMIGYIDALLNMVSESKHQSIMPNHIAAIPLPTDSTTRPLSSLDEAEMYINQASVEPISKRASLPALDNIYFQSLLHVLASLLGSSQYFRIFTTPVDEELHKAPGYKNKIHTPSHFTCIMARVYQTSIMLQSNHSAFEYSDLPAEATPSNQNLNNPFKKYIEYNKDDYGASLDMKLGRRGDDFLSNPMSITDWVERFGQYVCKKCESENASPKPYTNCMDCLRDLLLIGFNCQRFNPPAHEFHLIGGRFIEDVKNAWMKEFGQALPPFAQGLGDPKFDQDLYSEMANIRMINEITKSQAQVTSKQTRMPTTMSVAYPTLSSSSAFMQSKQPGHNIARPMPIQPQEQGLNQGSLIMAGSAPTYPNVDHQPQYSHMVQQPQGAVVKTGGIIPDMVQQGSGVSQGLYGSSPSSGIIPQHAVQQPMEAMQRQNYSQQQGQRPIGMPSAPVMYSVNPYSGTQHSAAAHEGYQQQGLRQVQLTRQGPIGYESIQSNNQLQNTPSDYSHQRTIQQASAQMSSGATAHANMLAQRQPFPPSGPYPSGYGQQSMVPLLPQPGMKQPQQECDSIPSSSMMHLQEGDKELLLAQIVQKLSYFSSRYQQAQKDHITKMLVECRESRGLRKGTDLKEVDTQTLALFNNNLDEMLATTQGLMTQSFQAYLQELQPNTNNDESSEYED